MQSDIVFLQETHLMYNEDLKIRRRWRGKVFSVSFNSQARGVTTLVHESIPLQVNKVIKDKFVRYLYHSRKFTKRANYLGEHLCTKYR